MKTRIVQAYQIEEDMWITCAGNQLFWANKGDYIVIDGLGNEWLRTKEEFEITYEEVR